MNEPKIYSFDSSLLPDAEPKDGFCVDLVRVGDYASLKAERDALAQRVEMLAQNLGNAIWGEQEALRRVNALAVENAELKARAVTVPAKVYVKDMRCNVVRWAQVVDALSEAGIAFVRDDGELISGTRETPATSAALAAIQAQGVEMAAAALDVLSAQSASATTQANFRAAAVYLRAEVLPAIGEAK